MSGVSARRSTSVSALGAATGSPELTDKPREGLDSDPKSVPSVTSPKLSMSAQRDQALEAIERVGQCWKELTKHIKDDVSEK